MALSFSPPLGETVVVDVAPQSLTVELHFAATFASQADYDEVKRSGIKVELWTDIPTKNRGDEGWRAIAFQEPTGINSTGGRFSLIPKRPSSNVVLHLCISVPLAGRDRFEYTHRLVYPSGRIKWLGKYACNGVLRFHHGSGTADPRFIPGEGFILSRNLGEAMSSGPDGWHETEVARLSPNFDWSICAMDDNAYVDDFSSLCFI